MQDIWVIFDSELSDWKIPRNILESVKTLMNPQNHQKSQTALKESLKLPKIIKKSLKIAKRQLKILKKFPKLRKNPDESSRIPKIFKNPTQHSKNLWIPPKNNRKSSKIRQTPVKGLKKFLKNPLKSPRAPRKCPETPYRGFPAKRTLVLARIASHQVSSSPRRQVNRHR